MNLMEVVQIFVPDRGKHYSTWMRPWGNCSKTGGSSRDRYPIDGFYNSKRLKHYDNTKKYKEYDPTYKIKQTTLTWKEANLYPETLRFGLEIMDGNTR